MIEGSAGCELKPPDMSSHMMQRQMHADPLVNYSATQTKKANTGPNHNVQAVQQGAYRQASEKDRQQQRAIATLLAAEANMDTLYGYAVAYPVATVAPIELRH